MTWQVSYLAEEDVVQVTAEGLHDRTSLRDDAETGRGVSGRANAPSNVGH